MIYLCLSMVLFFVAIFLGKENSLKHKVVFFFLGGVYLVCSIIYIVSNYFTNAGFDRSVLYHMLSSTEGADRDYMGLYIGLVIFIIIYILIYIFMYKKNKLIVKFYQTIFIISLAFLIHPLSKNLYDMYIHPKIKSVLNKDMSLFNTVYSPLSIKNIDKNKNKNIVFVYLESFENSFSDENIFPNLTPNLNRLKKNAIVFNNINQVTGTGWTIAGMVASQCGIPLFTYSSGNSMSGMDSFLPGIDCLGDLLKKEGYSQKFVGGANLKFAGKDKFLKTHGYDELIGFNKIYPTLMDKKYINHWGINDDTMYDVAYSEFLKLSKKKEKFVLTTLTLNTHFPRGFISRGCEEYSNNPYLNSIHCSDKVVSSFIDKILNSEYADDTLVVVLSDHLAMRNTADNYLKKMQRKNRFMILNSTESAREVDVVGSQLDVTNTIMPFIGFTAVGGLGQNLLNPTRDINATIEIHKNLDVWENKFVSFWNFPRIKKQIEIDLRTKKLKVDNDRLLSLPILLELDDKLNIKPKFEFGIFGNKSLSLVYQAKQNKNNYMLVHNCDTIYNSELKKMIDKKPTENVCILFSNAKNKTKLLQTNSRMSLSKKQIKKYLGIN